MSEIRRRRVLAVVTPYLIAVWLVMQVVSVITPALGLPFWAQTLTVVASIVGLPIVFYFAWFFDWTPEGVQRTPGLKDGDEIKPLKAGHWAGLAVTVVFALAGGFVSFGVISGNNAVKGDLAAAPSDKSVAVLPFDDLSPAQDLGYLAQGLAEEITVALGKVGNIRISAPNSAFRAAASDESLTEIGRRLGVAAILKGSVRTAGDQLRVTAQLISANDGLTIWTDAFSRARADAVMVEEQIARSILGVMLDRFLTDEDDALLDRPKAGEAHELYLRGREAMRLRTTESLKSARSYFEQTIAADEEYAPGYAGLALTMLLLAEGEDNYGNMDPGIAAQLASSNVEKALLRDPNLAEAHAVKGGVAALKGDRTAAIAAFDRAIDINPSYADAYMWRANAYLKERSYDSAEASLDDAFKLDPLSPAILFNKGFLRARAGDLKEARNYYNAILDLEENSPLGFRGLADVARRDGDLAESAKVWKRAVESSPASTQYKDNLVGALLTLEMPEAAAPFAEDYFSVNLKLAAGEIEAGLEEVRFNYAASPDDAYMAFEAGWYELLYGDEEAAAADLIAADAALPEDERFAMPYCSPAIEAAYAFRMRGDQEAAQTRIDRCAALLAEERESGVSSTELDYLAARIDALSGDGAAAAARLADAYQGGWREPWTSRDPLIKAAGESAALQASFAKIEADLARQRAELAPVVADWRAADE